MIKKFKSHITWGNQANYMVYGELMKVEVVSYGIVMMAICMIKLRGEDHHMHLPVRIKILQRNEVNTY